MEPGFLSRWWRDGRGEPTKLDLQLPPKERKPYVAPPPEPDLVPDRFFSFDFFIELTFEGVIYKCHPASPVRDIQSKQVRWGMNMKSMEKCLKNPSVPWVDDPERGLSTRTIQAPEDALGAEGKIAEQLHRFERILDLGKNVVVFALFNPASQSRLAYGISRAAFDQNYIATRPQG